jgi:energy-coupling factor transport system permease protein
MTLKQVYQSGDSWFHGMDPITKGFWVLTISLWLFFLRDWLSVSVVCALSILISFFGAKISLRKYLRIVIPLLLAGISLIMYQGAFRPGQGITVGPINFSYNGLGLGLILVSRVFGLIACSLAFSSTTKPKHMVLAMVRLGLPYRLAHIIYLALRFIPVVAYDVESINDAQTLRGVKHGVDRLVKLSVALLITEMRHVDETAIALEIRGFGLRETKTYLEEIKISRSGLLLACLTILVMVVHLYLLITGFKL